MNHLAIEEDFVPCPVADGDELFQNGIFVFTVSRIRAHLEHRPSDVAIIEVAVDSLPRWGQELDDAHVAAADLSRPLVFAEISPGSYNLIDGHHRAEKARRCGVATLSAFRLTAAQHLPFLTSTRAYRTYVEYWNGKVEERSGDTSH
jgi:hypothetical protein